MKTWNFIWKPNSPKTTTIAATKTLSLPGEVGYMNDTLSLDKWHHWVQYPKTILEYSIKERNTTSELYFNQVSTSINRPAIAERKARSLPRIWISFDNLLSILTPAVTIIKYVHITLNLDNHSWLTNSPSRGQIWFNCVALFLPAIAN